VTDVTASELVETMSQLPLKLFVFHFSMYYSLISYWNMWQFLKPLYFQVIGQECLFHKLWKTVDAHTWRQVIIPAKHVTSPQRCKEMKVLQQH